MALKREKASLTRPTLVRSARRILSLVVKEFRQILRDPRTFFLALIFPSFLLVLFGFGISLDIRDQPLAVVDYDQSQASRRLVRAFEASGYYRVVDHPARLAELDPLLGRGLADLALAIPRGFSHDLSRGGPTSVQLLIDGSDANAATITLGRATQIIQRFSADRIRAELPRRGVPAEAVRLAIDLRPRIWYNEELKSVWFMIPGLTGTIMTILGVLLTALGIARERERGTLEQLMVTPLRGHEIVLGKIIPYILLALVDVGLVLSAGRLVFGVPIRGSFLLLFVATALFLFASLGIGLLISTIAQTQQGAMMMAFIVGLLPSFLLSGFMFPIESMPAALQGITYILPVRYYLELLRAIALKAAGWSALWPELGLLSLLMLALLTASGWRLRQLIR